MNQSRLASIVEAIANTVFGFSIQATAQWSLFVFFDLPITTAQFWGFSLAMTVLSVARGYMIRRLWNAEWWKRFKRGDHVEKDMGDEGRASNRTLAMGSFSARRSRQS
jgi:hypothetical protein